MILAAGLGTRLRSVLGDLPKPLLEVEGETLLQRSVDTLIDCGLTSLTVVVGFGSKRVEEAAARYFPGVGITENPLAAQTGSMRSLALAWDELQASRPSEVWVVEGDLVFGRDAVSALAAAPTADAVVLTSTPTGAGDEVWVCGEGHRIQEIAKTPQGGASVLGELVGLTRMGAEALDALAAAHWAAGEAGAYEHYEERLSRCAEDLLVEARIVDGLPWGEIDEPSHLERVRAQVLPALERAAGARRDPSQAG